VLIALAIVALLPVAFIAARFALRAPLRILLPLYGALVPFGSGITLPIPLPNPFNTLTTLVGLALVLALVLHLVVVRTSAPRILPEVGAWLGFAAVNGMTYMWSIDRATTTELFGILVSLLALYVLVALMPINRIDLHRFCDVIVAGGALACVYGFYLLFTGNLPEENAGLPRFATAGGVGDASDPNITAATLILPLVLALSRALRATSATTRLLAGSATAIIAAGLLLTASRGGTLAAIVAILVLLAHERRPGRVAVGVAAALVVVFLAGAALAPEQVERLSKTGSSGRTDIWTVAEAACPDYCVIGSGLNTFTDVHRRFYLVSPNAAGFRIDERPHNIWLGTAIELGLPGLATFLVGLALTLRTLIRLPRSDRGAPLAALAGFLVSNMFLANLYFKYFWLVLVYAAVAALATREHPADLMSSTPTSARSLQRTAQ
jgi:O-antigen ligase